MNIFIVQVDYDAPPSEVPPEMPLVFTDLRTAKAHCQAEVREFGSGKKLSWVDPHKKEAIRTWSSKDRKKGQPTANFFISEQDLPAVRIEVARRAWSFIADVPIADQYTGEAEYDELVAELEAAIE